MNRIGRSRRRMALALPATMLLAAAGCISIGGDAPAFVWYVLDDRDAGSRSDREGAAAAPATAPAAGSAGIDRVLLVGPVAASSFYDSTMLAYGRASGTRAHYQFAGWTERPASRAGVLVGRRLAGRGRFAAVAQSTSGVRGDLLLNLALEHLYHDVSTSPGRARVAMVAELVRWSDRTLLARRAFERTAEVQREAADAAVDALNRAFASLLDELCPWVESAAARGTLAG